MPGARYPSFAATYAPETVSPSSTENRRSDASGALPNDTREGLSTRGTAGPRMARMGSAASPEGAE